MRRSAPGMHRFHSATPSTAAGEAGFAVRDLVQPAVMTDDLPPLILVRNLDGVAETRQQHARAVANGRERRLSRGVYLDSTSWAALAPREKYLAFIRGVVETRRNRPVLSHWSAVAVHDLPMVGAWPQRVHVTTPAAGGGRSGGVVVRHPGRLRDEDVVEIDGLLVTSIARTAVDIAASRTSMIAAVSVIDRALHEASFGVIDPLADKETLLACWESMLPFKASRRAHKLIRFGEQHSDSPLESASRVGMWTLGVPRPRLQTAHYDNQGLIGYSDFDWPDFGAIGESDGDKKYLDAQFRSGRTAEQVLLDEKKREDRLRAISRSFARWGWADAIYPTRLSQKLRPLGLPTGKPWPV